MNEIVRSARDWIDTPYVHQQSVKRAGCDCLGLVRGVWREVRGHEPETPPAYTRDWSEPSGDEALWRAALRHLLCRPLDAERSGDILLFRMRDGAVAKHLGIQAECGTHPTFIHAYSGRSVRESPLSWPWRRRIVARFAFPEEDI